MLGGIKQWIVSLKSIQNLKESIMSEGGII